MTIPRRNPDTRTAELEAARLMLARLGVSAAELVDRPGTAIVSADSRSASSPVSTSVSMPTFAAYVPEVTATVGVGTRRVYGPYWNRLLASWGDRGLHEPTPTEIETFMVQIKADVVPRRNARGGTGAAEHFLGALRLVYRHAERDGLIAAADNPAARVAKPRRQPSPRRAIPATGLAQINRVAASTGNDPALDAMLLRLHTETACRRGGALALRPEDLDPDQCVIRLREKGDTVRWQPVTPTLMSHLLAHAAQHRAAPGEQLLRAANGRPITTRRYDHLWSRLGAHLPWVATQQISTHWLRHTTLTWVERHFGASVAAAYAGHGGTGYGRSVTAGYTRAGVEEVAAALCGLTGEPHPLAH